MPNNGAHHLHARHIWERFRSTDRPKALPDFEVGMVDRGGYRFDPHLTAAKCGEHGFFVF
jgi:hypothetical protein